MSRFERGIAIPGRPGEYIDPRDLSTTPGGTIYGTTPGGINNNLNNNK
jgi:hypothetical protein